MAQLPLLCLNPAFRSLRHMDFCPITFTVRGHQGKTRIANKNVMLFSYPKGLTPNDSFVFTHTTTLFVKDCHPDFVQKFIRRVFFPKVNILYLCSDPSYHSGILKEFSNVTVTDKYSKQLEIFKPDDYRRIINNGYMEAILKNYDKYEDIILERDELLNQQINIPANMRILEELNKLTEKKRDYLVKS